MEAIRRFQGRSVTDKDIKTIQSIIASNPTWHRTRIYQELCHLWNWKNDTGKMKDIAARALLRKLDKENLRYLVYDCEDRILGCLLFGAPAWSVAYRDRYIGWDEVDRRKGLSRIANNMRCLILSEVKVPHSSVESEDIFLRVKNKESLRMKP